MIQHGFCIPNLPDKCIFCHNLSSPFIQLDYYTCLLFSFTLIRCIRREIGSHKKFLMLRTKNKTQLNAVSYFLLACVRGFELSPLPLNPHRKEVSATVFSLVTGKSQVFSRLIKNKYVSGPNFSILLLM